MPISKTKMKVWATFLIAVLIIGGAVAIILVGAQRYDATFQCLDKEGNILSNVEISVGESRRDIASIYTADSEGKFQMKKVKPRKLTFYIPFDESNLKCKYKITRRELQKGKDIILYFE